MNYITSFFTGNTSNTKRNSTNTHNNSNSHFISQTSEQKEGWLSYYVNKFNPFAGFNDIGNFDIHYQNESTYKPTSINQNITDRKSTDLTNTPKKSTSHTDVNSSDPTAFLETIQKTDSKEEANTYTDSNEETDLNTEITNETSDDHLFFDCEDNDPTENPTSTNNEKPKLENLQTNRAKIKTERKKPSSKKEKVIEELNKLDSNQTNSNQTNNTANLINNTNNDTNFSIPTPPTNPFNINTENLPIIEKSPYSTIETITKNWEPKFRNEYLAKLQAEYQSDSQKTIGSNALLTQEAFSNKWAAIVEKTNQLNQCFTNQEIKNHLAHQVTVKTIGTGSALQYRISRQDIFHSLLMRPEIMALLLNGTINFLELIKLVDAIMRLLEKDTNPNINTLPNDRQYEAIAEEIKKAINAQKAADILKNSKIIQDNISLENLKAKPTKTVDDSYDDID